MSKNIEQFINIENRPFQSLSSHLVPELMDHDGNIVAIWTTIPFPYRHMLNMEEEIKQKLIQFKRDENTKFVFDGMWEGHSVGVIPEIYKIIDTVNINPKNCYYITGALNIEDIYNKYCIKYDIKNRMKVYGVNAWEFNTASSFKNFDYTPKYEVREKNKLFVCYNRMNRPHRTALLGLLFDKNLVENSYYSYYLQAYHDSSTMEGGMKRLNLILNELSGLVSNKTLSIIQNNIIKHKEKFPLVLSLRNVDDNANQIRMIDFEFSNNSYFSLVTESFYFPYKNGDECEHAAIFFSEKIFKPIGYKQPFILVGRPRGLKYLKNMGYKTFSPFIDESYDEIEDDEQRLLAIVAEVERLSKMSTIQWIDWQTNLKEIIEHNFSVFINKKQFIAQDGKWLGEYVYVNG